MRKIVKLSIASLVIGTLIAGLIAEVSLRVLRDEMITLVGRQHSPCIYRTDPYIGYRYVPNSSDWMHRYFEIDTTVHINGLGFHDAERTVVDRPEAHTILAIGDSFTASLHVPLASTWTQVLEKLLNDPGDEIPTEVINLGVDGTGTDKHVYLLKRHLDLFQPDVVILAFYENDISDAAYRANLTECYNGVVMDFRNQNQRIMLQAIIDENKPSALQEWAFENIYIYRLLVSKSRSGQLLLHNRTSLQMIGEPAHKTKPFIRPLQQHLLELRRLSDEYGFDLIIVPVPAKEDEYLSLTRLTDNVPREVLGALPLVTVYDAFDRLRARDGLDYEDLFWRHDGHLNAQGYDLFARALAEKIDPRLQSARQQNGADNSFQ